MSKGTLNAEPRTEAGKGAAGRLRKLGRIPAVLYGGEAGPEALSVVEKDVRHALKSGARILDVTVGGKTVSSLLKDVQYDHLGVNLIHLDLQRLVKGDEIQINVPIVYKGTPVGLKEEGVFNVVHDTLEISCQPEDVPAEIVVDISGLEMGASLHVRDLTLPAGVRTEEDGDAVIAVVTYADTEEETATAPEEAAAQPEVIGEAERKAAAESKGAPSAGGGKKE